MPVKKLEVDAFMMVPSGGLTLVTCDPDAGHQIFQDNAFRKPQRLMSVSFVFGPTLTGSDDPEHVSRERSQRRSLVDTQFAHFGQSSQQRMGACGSD